MVRLLFAFSLLWSSTALAEPLLARHAVEVRLSAPRGKRALAIRASADGWRVELGPSAAKGVAEIFDVTPGTPATTLSVLVTGGELRLDRARFVGGHAYRVQLRVDGKPGPSGFIYLQPETATKEPSRKKVEKLRFDADETPASSDTIQTVEKSL